MLRNRFWSALGSIALALSALMLFRVETARADVIEQTADFGPLCRGANVPCPVGSSGDTALQFNKFNPSQGTLTAVTLTLTSQTTLVLFYHASVLNEVSATDNVNLMITAPNLVFNESDEAECSGISACDFGPLTVQNNRGPVTPSSIAQYIGNGTLDVLLSSSDELSSSGCTPSLLNDCGGGPGGTSSWSGSVTLDYTFTPATPVPEPASLAIFGTALAGLGLIRRRRKHG